MTQRGAKAIISNKVKLASIVNIASIIGKVNYINYINYLIILIIYNCLTNQ